MHTVAEAAAYWPALQLTGATDWLAQCDPAGQSVHTVANASEYCPATHAVGPVTVVDAQYDPATQSLHTVARVAEYWPNKHATGKSVGVVQNEPTGQAIQVVELDEAYWPEAHAVATLSPASAHWLPAGQARHTVWPVWGV